MAGVVHRHHHFARRGYCQRVYVERTKPLEQYTTEELYVRFRFGKADIEYLVNLLRPKLQHRTQRSHGLSVEDQILIALRFYACGTFYQVVSDYMGVVKSAVCDVVRDVSIALASLVNEFVSFPKDNQIAQTKRSFFLLGNMPNTIGAIERNVPLCADNDAPEPLGDPNQPPAFCQNEQTGRATRDAIVRHYF
ncbi:hypothetical protein G5714_017983 [Onychostoma macrolepis]|uniref:Nuclease HARBI1 n=1 Tax=Onychostoma macrolepis TaxID=369639 RepID=A0A7J6C3B5_9TELE|nr:hypothetical protein G5714_017983 [Onychostoma macrolepis]